MTREATDEIRARIDLVDLIGAHVRLTKSGRSFKGLCPFHEEKTPSFHVNPERGMWHCFGCGEHGDCFTFLMRLETLSFPEALQRCKQGRCHLNGAAGASRDEHDEIQARWRAPPASLPNASIKIEPENTRKTQ